MTTNTFTANTTAKAYVQTINAAPERVFPLLCPVREAEWLDGWHYTMLWSRSGLVEEGAVFTTPGKGEADTVWIVTRHDREQRAVEFTRFTPDSRVCVLRIRVTPHEPGSPGSTSPTPTPRSPTPGTASSSASPTNLFVTR